MKEYTQAVVTLLALINPLVCVRIFMDCVSNLPKDQRIVEAVKAITTIGMVLYASSFFGMAVLKAFGISIPAFSCAGGAILAWIGAGMLTPKSEEPDALPGITSKKTSLSPLILFAASPGTITGVITIAAAHNKPSLPVTAIAGVTVAVAVLAIALLLAATLAKGRSHKSGMQKMISSYMGVLIIAMGIQFMLNGISSYLH